MAAASGGTEAVPDVYWNHAFERAQIGGSSRAGIGDGGDVAEPTLWRDHRPWGVHHVRFRSAFCSPLKPRRSAINQATYFGPIFENTGCGRLTPENKKGTLFLLCSR